MTQKQIQFRGILIRAIPSSEADLIVAILDEHGEKHITIAKQARKSRKRFGSSLDIFDFGRFEASQGRGGMPILQSFIPEPGFRKIRESLSRIACASVLVEAIDLLIPEGHADKGEHSPFQIAEETLSSINESTDIKSELRALYTGLSQILEFSGYHDKETERQPSLHALRLTIAHLEWCVERRLKSKESLEMVTRSLAAQSQETVR